MQRILKLVIPSAIEGNNDKPLMPVICIEKDRDTKFAQRLARLSISSQLLSCCYGMPYPIVRKAIDTYT
ncbi:hypothetical protein SAMN05660880_02301 [Luteibacter sp. 22Crub2.1]|nr:hypothetical protein SAMN05660880_02301 [Luteibacter sp. 22Crub2.1]